MMNSTVFTGLLVVFWLAEFAFAAIVVYWFVTQGFSEPDPRTEAGTGPRPLEDWAYTRTSLLMWAGFFVAIVLLIVIGA